MATQRSLLADVRLRPRSSTSWDRTERPFDLDLSLTLDDVIIELDAGATGLRRWLLLLRKRWLERQVPAWYPEVRS